MNAVNIAELKNRLSHYLRIVKSGKPVLIRDRDRIIARIEAVRDPADLEDAEERRIADLVARGVLRAPKKRMTRAMHKALLARRPKIDPRIDVVGMLLEERKQR